MSLWRDRAAESSQPPGSDLNPDTRENVEPTGETDFDEEQIKRRVTRNG